MKWKNILKGVAGVLAAALLLWLSFKNIDFKSFVTGMKQCKWQWMAVALASGYCALILRGQRWRKMLQPLGLAISFRHSFDAYNAGNLASFALPGSGELVRGGFIADREVSYDKVLGTETTERIIDAISILILIASVLLISNGATATFFKENIIDTILSGFTLSKAIITLLTVALIVTLSVTIKKYGSRVKMFERICKFFSGLWGGMNTVRAIDNKFSFTIYTILIWICYWIEAESVALSLSDILSLAPPDTLFICLLGSIASIIPTPGGLGAYHYLIALAFSSLFGFSWDNGILFATLLHEPHNLIIVLTGLISLISLRKKGHK